MTHILNRLCSLRLWACVAIVAIVARGRAQSAMIRIHLGPNGAQASNRPYGFMAFTQDDRFVAFDSLANNLAPNDANPGADIFVYDQATGALELASSTGSGGPANGACNGVRMSADGRWIFYASLASNLVMGDTNGKWDIFRFDRQTQAVDRVSLGTGGVQGNGDIGQLSISADGRFLAFTSSASNLVAGDVNLRPDVFLRDLSTGTISCISAGSIGPGTIEVFPGLDISADGRFVAFTSSATNLVAFDSNASSDIFVWDVQGSSMGRASVGSSGAEAAGHSENCAISADGRWVAFDSLAPNLVAGDTNNDWDVFVHDRLLSTTVRVSVTSAGGQGSSSSAGPVISADGRLVAFASFSVLDPGDTNGAWDTYVHDRITSATALVSLSTAASAPNGPSFPARFSPDARFLGIFSGASDLVPGDTNGVEDFFVIDRGPASVQPYCGGDGSATPCPCANLGGADRGCQSSLAIGGARIGASGTASVSADTLVLYAAHVPASTVCLFVQGTARANGGLGLVMGDGLSCLAGSIVFVGTKSATAGTCAFGSLAGGPPISVTGAVPSAGGIFTYQVAYRNAASWCTPSTFNWTNALAVQWIP